MVGKGSAFQPTLSNVPTPFTSVSCPMNIVVGAAVVLRWEGGLAVAVVFDDKALQRHEVASELHMSAYTGCGRV